MIKRLSIVASLITLILTSCNSQAPTETAVATLTETQSPTQTDSPIQITDTPVSTEISTTALPQPGMTPTAETPQPTNIPDCTNSASFVSDVTIPDNTEIGQGTPFTKTWRVSNTGTCIWGPDYTLAYYSEERMNAPASVDLPVTYPGQPADISVTLIAPNSLGTHRGNFVIKNPAGLIMKVDNDSRLWLVIKVTSDTSNATAAPGTGAGLAPSTCAYTADVSNITETIDAINAYRAANGLPAYNVNSQLDKAAQSHAADMVCNSLFDHKGSNGSTIPSRVTDSGYVFSYVTENVYSSYPALSGAGVVNWWKNDKTDLRHNLNLISDTYIDIGVGYAFYNNYGAYVVVFGTP